MIDLELSLTSGPKPALNKTTFRHPLVDREGNEQNAVRGKDEGAHPRDYGSFPWSRAVQALAVFLLRWAAWARRPRLNGSSREPVFEGGRGSLAASLNFALSKKNDWLCEMFGYDVSGEPLLLRFIRRSNPDLKRPDEPVALSLDQVKLPPGRITVYLDGQPCEDAGKLEELAQTIEDQWQGAAESPADLTGGGSGPQSGPVHTQTHVGLRVKLKLDRDFDRYLQNPKERDQLLRKVWEELRCPSARAVSIQKGCVELTLELTPEEAERLFWAAKAGALDEFGLIEVELVPAAVAGSPEAAEVPCEEESQLVGVCSPAVPEVTPRSDEHAPRRRGVCEPPLTSVTLLERIRNGNQLGWAQFVDLYTPLLYHWLRKDSKLPVQEVEDLVQDVFLTVFRSLTSFSETRGSSFRRWLWSVTHRRLMDYFRARQKRAAHNLGNDDLSVPDSHSAPVSDHEELGILLRGALDMIRPHFEERTWQAFRVVVLEGRTPSEVAAELGMSVAAVYKLKSRVLRQLREIMEDYLE